MKVISQKYFLEVDRTVLTVSEGTISSSGTSSGRNLLG